MVIPAPQRWGIRHRKKNLSHPYIYICIHICIYKRIQNKHSQMISYGHACSLFCKGDQTWREVGAHWQNPNHPKNTSPSYTSPLPEYPLPLWKCRCRTLGSSGCQKSIVMKIDVSRSFPFTSFTSIIIHPKSSRPKKHLSISPSISQLNGTFSRLRTQWENFSAISGNFPIIPLGFQKKNGSHLRWPSWSPPLDQCTGDLSLGKPLAESTDGGIATQKKTRWEIIIHIMWR